MARVLAAMSGGVDSSVAALLCTRQGHEVIGVTILGTGPLSDDEPCREKSRDAREVCEHLGIPHREYDLREEFVDEVVADFVCGYAEGLTPNPCVICNPRIKWGHLLDYAVEESFEALATGHYAIIDHPEDRYRLRRGIDEGRDQSYMLYRLAQDQLSHTLLPLGEYRKTQVRDIARDDDLPAARTPDSQDLCFVPEGDYVDFLRGRIPIEPGPILDLDGNTIGHHDGLACYTVGQRRGLGIAADEPLYVVAADPENNALIVGPRESVQQDMCSLHDLNWVSIPPPDPGVQIEGEIEVRYRTTPIPATIVVGSTGAMANLSESAVCAPGQSAVLYDDDILLGGGIIGRHEEVD